MLSSYVLLVAINTTYQHTVFGSAVVVCICLVVVVIIYVIPYECKNFRFILNFAFKPEPCIDHIKVSDKFENTGYLDNDLQGQIGLETSKIWF